MLRITVSERDTDIGGDLTCTCMYAVAFGERTGENHHTYGTLLQVSFATWAGLFFSVQSSTHSFISNFGSSERYVVLIHLYRSKKSTVNYPILTQVNVMAAITFRFGRLQYSTMMCVWRRGVCGCCMFLTCGGGDGGGGAVLMTEEVKYYVCK